MTDLDPGQVMTIKRFNEIRVAEHLKNSGKSIGDLNKALTKAVQEITQRAKAQQEGK